MSKIPLWMDLFSGLLLAYDFYPKSGWPMKFYNWVKDNVEKTDTNNIRQIRTIIFNSSIALLIFITLFLWALYKTNNNPDTQLGSEVLFFAVGFVIALALITLLAIKFQPKKNPGLTAITASFITFVILVILSVVRIKSVNLVTALIGFMYMCMFYSLAIETASFTRNLLLAENKSEDEKKPFYMFALMGLALFVASHVIQIAS